jgi:hypothetical protein
VEYAGLFIDDGSVAGRALDYAYNKQSFVFWSNVLGYDPKPGVPKTGMIVYRYDDTGPLRCLVVNDYESKKFED